MVSLVYESFGEAAKKRKNAKKLTCETAIMILGPFRGGCEEGVNCV